MAMSKTSTIGLTVSGRETIPATARPRLDESQVFGCSYGEYPWDDWESWAVAQGVSDDLASTTSKTFGCSR